MTATINGLVLGDVTTVLFKFYFTNDRLIPRGINMAEKRDERRQGQLDAKNLLEATPEAPVGGRKSFDSLPASGQHRQGRVDTGTPIYQNLQQVQVAVIRRGLATNGFGLTDIHYFVQEKPGQTKKFVVVMSFTKGAPSIEVSSDVTRAVRLLANDVWGACHVWQNPGKPATVNVMQRMHDGVAKKALVVRDHVLRVIDIEQHIDEAGE